MTEQLAHVHPSGTDGPADVHDYRSALAGVTGTIFTFYILVVCCQFWLGEAGAQFRSTLSFLALAALTGLLAVVAFRVQNRRPRSKEILILALATMAVVPTSQVLAGATLRDSAFLLASPAACGWAVYMGRHRWASVLIVAASTGLWDRGSIVPIEAFATTTASVVLAGIAYEVLSRGAEQADAAVVLQISRRAKIDSELAAHMAGRAARRVIHDKLVNALKSAGAFHSSSLAWEEVQVDLQAAGVALRRTDTGPRDSDLVRQLEDAASSVRKIDVRIPNRPYVELPSAVQHAMSGAVGEALRNVAEHARVAKATVMVTRIVQPDGAGAQVDVIDQGVGFNPGSANGDRLGVRNSIVARLEDVGGEATIESTPGAGTRVRLRWTPSPPAPSQSTPASSWAKELIGRPRAVFLGYMLAPLACYAVLFVAHLRDQRSHLLATGSFLGVTVLAVISARHASRLRMTTAQAMSLAAANTILAFLGVVSINPAGTDAFAYWMGGQSGIAVAAIAVSCGWRMTAVALTADVTALSLGLHTSHSQISQGGWFGCVGSPIIAAAFGYAHRRGFVRVDADLRAGVEGQARAQTSLARERAAQRQERLSLERSRLLMLPLLSITTDAALRNPRMVSQLANDTRRLIGDELRAPQLCDAALIDRLTAHRSRGTKIELETDADLSRELSAGQRLQIRNIMNALLDISEWQALSLHTFERDNGFQVLINGTRPSATVTDIRDELDPHGAATLASEDGVTLQMELTDHAAFGQVLG